ncbi:hypothetical protein LN042_35250 [Kitasatospora sp. RB6PN24]|uniref:hypothetical protein n=1 Tax=Kitasatospora humi TaxID=2893891 RepID=UPI001E52275D|nr:hypothetical protein [Kitasatospora humi]MCC9312261.1 hypothetical protein [Kitasatospora humi]
MGIAIGVLLVVLVGGGSAVATRLRRYPGGLAYAFGAAFAPERRQLAAARRTVRQLRHDANRELMGARNDVRGARARHRYELELATRRVEQLRDPGRGALLGRLGVVALHQHAVMVSTEELPLAGLTVRFERIDRQYCLHFAVPGGGVHRQVFERALHAEEEVRRFGNRVVNAVAEENARLKRRNQLVAAAEAELRAVEQRTAPQRSARDRLAGLTVRQDVDQRLAEAVKALDDARARWRSRTGRMPI